MGDLEGEFYLDSSGNVFYRHPPDEQRWYVNRSIAEFFKSADAFNTYSEEVTKVSGEAEQLQVVGQLRAALSIVESLGPASDSFWPVILEQAERGMS